ncbi:MAG: L-ribulose-5-phosphate 4-epimerase AraD [Spirochaetales bacterium]|nr:L-ribulose-5-phosphate 4-epimerase AraD [Spirochaetales bacterium]
MQSKYKELKEETFLANLEIPQRNLAIYTWGNVSGFDKNRGVFAIKPSGVPYDKLKTEDIVIIDLEGKKVEGELNPSSDTPTHLEIYKAHPEIGGITHTHSPHATAWAQAMKSIPILGTTQADHLANAIICSRYLSEKEVLNGYEKNTGILIVETFQKPETGMDIAGAGAFPEDPLVFNENPMILIGGHGPFSWGNSASNSVYNAAVLEECARMAWMVKTINPDFTQLPDYIINKHYQRKHGKNAYYGQSKG